MRVKRSRALLALVTLVVACAPFIALIQESAPVHAATSSSTGTPGAFSVRDTSVNPGARCDHLVANDVYQVTIAVTSPTAQAYSGDTARMIEWQPLIYQLFPNGSTQLVASGTVQSRTVGFGTNATFTTETFNALPEGPAYQARGVITWRNADNSVKGTRTLTYEMYRSVTPDANSVVSGGCLAIVAAELAISSSRVTVDTMIAVSGRYFPISAPVPVIWNGKTVATFTSNADGTVYGTFKMPATPIGDHKLQLNAGTWWRPSTTITIAPRVKMIPSSASRGQTVKISLRGFAQRETVRIRWKKGSSWVELGRVTTSSTGSGELYVVVPSWAPDGTGSVRGDGSVGRAQTNAVYISGGAFKAASTDATPVAIPSPTASPTPTTAGSPVVEPSFEPTESATTEPTVEIETPVSTEPADPTQTPEPTLPEGSPAAIAAD